MFDIDLWSLEPLMRRNHPPEHNRQHGSSIDKTGPVHGGWAEIRTGDAGETEDRHHQGGETGCCGADDGAVASEMPGSATEAGSDEEGADGDGDGEGDEGGDGRDAEDRANRDFSREDEKC